MRLEEQIRKHDKHCHVVIASHFNAPRLSHSRLSIAHLQLLSIVPIWLPRRDYYATIHLALLLDLQPTKFIDTRFLATVTGLAREPVHIRYLPIQISQTVSINLRNHASRRSRQHQGDSQPNEIQRPSTTTLVLSSLFTSDAR